MINSHTHDPIFFAPSLDVREEVIEVDLSHRNGEDHLKIEVALKVVGNTAIEYAILTEFNKEDYDEHVAEIMWAIKDSGFEREF